MNLNYKKIAGFMVAFTILIFIPLFFSFAAQGNGTTIQNPLGSGTTEVKDLLLTIMNLVAKIGSIIVVIFIIFAGYKFVTAGDSESERTAAKAIFRNTIIGAAILLGADVIANVVVNTVKDTIQ